jgi:hypothetical protein
VMKKENGICFVVNEIMPFTMGGIGAFQRNMLKYYARYKHLTVLYYGDSIIADDIWSRLYPNVSLIRIDAMLDKTDQQFDNNLLQISYSLMETLLRLEADGCVFDVIEFVDWGGPAFFSIEAKRSGKGLNDTCISVRIHSTDGILRQYEWRAWDAQNAMIADFERKALLDADIVIAHVSSIRDALARHYGFSSDWLEKVVINTPPVLISPIANNTIKPVIGVTDIMFTSKFQEIKRPDIFIKGTIEFLERTPEYKGNIVFDALDGDITLRERIDTLISRRFKHRILFNCISPLMRNTAVANSVVVIPNAYEAFCFAAYEASLLGSFVVLNGENPAFGPGTPWIDGENCIKFDGSVGGLSSALRRAFYQCPALSPVRLIANENPYWMEDVSAVQALSCNSPISITAIVMHRDDHEHLNITISDLLTYRDIEINVIIVDQCSSSTDSLLMLDTLNSLAKNHGSLSVTRFASRCGWPAAINAVRQDITTDFTIIIPAGARFSPGFLKEATEALTKNPRFWSVVPRTATIHCTKDTAHGTHSIFNPIGEGLTSGTFYNTVCGLCFIVRSDILKQYLLNEQMESEYEWEYILRLCRSQGRVMIWPFVAVTMPLSVSRAWAFKDRDEQQRNLEIIRRMSGVGRAHAPDTLVFMSDSEAHLNDEAHRELEIRRAVARTRASFRGVEKGECLRKLFWNMFWRKPKGIEAWLDSINGSTSSEKKWIVDPVENTSYTFIGWWRPRDGVSSAKYLSLLLKGRGIDNGAEVTRFQRLDVALTFELDELGCWGFRANMAWIPDCDAMVDIVLKYELADDDQGSYKLGVIEVV